MNYELLDFIETQIFMIVFNYIFIIYLILLNLNYQLFVIYKVFLISINLIFNTVLYNYIYN